MMSSAADLDGWSQRTLPAIELWRWCFQTCSRNDSLLNRSSVLARQSISFYISTCPALRVAAMLESSPVILQPRLDCTLDDLPVYCTDTYGAFHFTALAPLARTWLHSGSLAFQNTPVLIVVGGVVKAKRPRRPSYGAIMATNRSHFSRFQLLLTRN